MGFLNQLIEQFKNVWAKFSALQKASIVAASSIAVIGLVFMIWMTQQPDMEALYTNLNPKDASAIAAKLKEQKVEYRLADEGRTILVPSKDRYQLRLDMAGKINLNGVVGFESFQETRFGETDTDKRVRFLVALQGELTRTIEELDEVEAAKVHIALPQPSLFLKDQKDPTASVLLRLKAYASLKPEQIKSIMAFVSHSVEGLQPANVTVMDVNGNLLSEDIADLGVGGSLVKFSATQIALKQQYEADLAKSIQSMLERTRGPGKAVVRASVAMDFDQVERRSEVFGDPVLVSEQTREESSKGTGSADGANPADTNMGGPTYGTSESTSSERQVSERTRNYEVSKTVETKVAAPGKVTKVSLSVLVDGELTPQEQEKTREAVAMAAGIDLTRGDQVSVVGIPFNNEAAAKYEQQLADAEKAKRTREYIEMALVGLVVAAAVGLVVFMLRRYKPSFKPAVMTARAEAAVAGDAGAVSFDVSPLTPEVTEKQVLRAKVEKLATSNPEAVAKVVKTWLVED